MGKKVVDTTVAEISATNDMEDSAKREEIYEENRDQIQYKFRLGNRNILLCIYIGCSSGIRLRIFTTSAVGSSRAPFISVNSSHT